MAEEKLGFNRSFLILGNLGLLTWISLASACVMFYDLLYGWLYLLFLVIMTYGVMRRLGCRSCSKCKSCTGGFGRLAGVFFGKGFTKWESVGNWLGFVAFMYVLLLPIPVTLFVLSPLGASLVVGVFVLVCLFALAAYSLISWVPAKR